MIEILLSPVILLARALPGHGKSMLPCPAPLMVIAALLYALGTSFSQTVHIAQREGAS